MDQGTPGEAGASAHIKRQSIVSWAHGHRSIVSVTATLALAVVSYFILVPKSTDVQVVAHSANTSFITDASKRIFIVGSEGRMCAEPTPDGVAAFAASLSLDQGSKIESEQSFEKLFRRSQGIQALRDGMYRLCEAYLNGAVDESGYGELVGDYVTTLNFIVPIELCADLARDMIEDLSTAFQSENAKQADGAASKQGEENMVHVGIDAGKIAEAVLGPCILAADGNAARLSDYLDRRLLRSAQINRLPLRGSVPDNLPRSEDFIPQQ